MTLGVTLLASLPGPAPAAGPALTPAAPAAAALGAAPDFTRADLAGHPVRLSRLRGKVILLSFWATWCEPCRSEAPRFSAWQKRYRNRGLQVIGISMDDARAPVEQFVRRYNLAYPVIVGDPALGALYGGILGLPLTYLIDPSGQIVARYRGEPDLDRMETEIRRLLGLRGAPRADATGAIRPANFRAAR